MVPDLDDLIRYHERILEHLRKARAASVPPEGIIIGGKLVKRSSAQKVVDALHRLTKMGTQPIDFDEALKTLMERREVAGETEDEARLQLNKSIKQSRGMAWVNGGRIHTDPKRKSRVARKYFTS